MTDLVAFINHHPYHILAGETMLTFINRHKGAGYVPTLCDSDILKPYGACRICQVEVTTGSTTKMVAACHTPVRSGDQISTNSSGVETLRRNIMELIVSDHPLDCLTCKANGHCDLQTVAARVGLSGVRYNAGADHRHYTADESHPYLRADLSKCINCYKCVRVCDEVQGTLALAVSGRGFDAKILIGQSGDFGSSYCVSCGACAQICPTAALSDIYKPAARQSIEEIRTVCTYCGVGCNLEVSKNENNVLAIQGAKDAEVNKGHLCVKGRYAFEFYRHPDRLKEPMIRKNGVLTPVSWPEALTFIAQHLGHIKSKHGAKAIGGISSARCTNEENYLMQKFMRVVVGTNNIDGCARVCHAPTAAGMRRAFGTGAATNSIEDIKHTRCILIIGANPTAAHPVTGAKIKQAALKGIPLIVIDPRKTEMAKLAQHHLALRPGTNVALLNMMLYYIVEEGLVNETFVRERCEGYEDLVIQLKPLDLEAMENITGVNREAVKAAAKAYATASAAMSFHGLGVTEHYQGTHTVQLIADLAMLTGHIGRPGTGVNPLRGQNNVQGSADMGVQPDLGPGYLNIRDPQVRDMYEQTWQQPFADNAGLTSQAMIDEALTGELKALYVIGEDLIQTEPNSEKIRRALNQLDFLVVQELFPSETTAHATVVLPASSFLEKSGTFTNGERRVQKVNAVIQPVSGTKPDGQILVELMREMGYYQPDYHPAWVLEEIARMVPFFNGITWDNLGTQGKQWPVNSAGEDTKILHQQNFKRGKGLLQFIPFQPSPELQAVSPEYPFILTTNRNLSHYNSGSMTRRTRNTLLDMEDVLLIHPDDAKDLQLLDRDKVEVSSTRGHIHLTALISKQVNPGVVSTTFHHPELDVNNLTGDVVDQVASCPEYKVVAVQIKKLAANTKIIHRQQEVMPRL